MNSPLHIDEISETYLTCLYCHWDGLGDETDTSTSYGDLREIYCPSCAEVIGLVKYPAISVSADVQCDLLQSLPVSHINAGAEDGKHPN